MIFKHLLPKGRAWSLMVEKPLKQFFTGLSEGLLPPLVQFIDQVYQDVFSATTREIDPWETQLGIPSADISEAEKRSRLDAAWKDRGGQSPRHIQDTLQAFGFDVYVHEWWELPVVGAPVARNPNDFISTPLVNKIWIPSRIESITAGDAVAEAGEFDMQAGNFTGTEFSLKTYDLPTDPDLYPFFLYIGGATFPNLAPVPFERVEEFEDLCLKLCPNHLWLGLLIESSGSLNDILVDDVGNTLVDDLGNILTAEP